MYAASALCDMEWEVGQNTTTVIGIKQRIMRINIIF
jgi:hypothetical protein